MSPSIAYHALLAETAALIARHRSVADLIDCDLSTLPFTAPLPHVLPVTARVQSNDLETSPETAPLADLIKAHAPLLNWQHSYTEAQVGAAFLANYGWFNLVSPEGPFVHETRRISVGYWGQGLTYPQHSHAPEEIYMFLAGRARVSTQGRAPVDATASTLIHHPPHLPHGMTLPTSGVLAMAVWRGTDLLKPSHMGGTA